MEGVGRNETAWSLHTGTEWASGPVPEPPRALGVWTLGELWRKKGENRQCQGGKPWDIATQGADQRRPGPEEQMIPKTVLD